MVECLRWGRGAKPSIHPASGAGRAEIVACPSSFHHLSFLDGVEGPVSVSSMFSPADSSVMAMQDAAVLQGDRKTSAPICVKLGFREVCSIDFCSWGNP